MKTLTQMNARIHNLAKLSFGIVSFKNFTCKKLLALVVVLVTIGINQAWATSTTLFHETFGDNSGSARAWNNTYSVKSGVSSVYSGISSYTITNAKQSKNTMGQTLSALSQTTMGTDASIIIGPLDVSDYTNLILSYQWKAASVKKTYSTNLYYATSKSGTYTSVTKTGAGATDYVEVVGNLPEAAQVNTLYIKIVWNTSNAQAYIDEVNLSGEELTPSCTDITPTLTYSSTTLSVGSVSSTPTVSGNTGSGTITYSSSNTSVATVDASGVVSAVSVGSATITASIAASGSYCSGSASASITVEPAACAGDNLDFSSISGFSDWTTSYSQQVVDYTNETVTFASANRSTVTITDIPVTKGNDVSIVAKNGKTITAVEFVCRQWSSNAQTITLHYSTDGGTNYTTTGVTSSNFYISNSSLPSGTNAVKISFSSTTKQVGIESACVTLGAGSPAITVSPASVTGLDYALGSGPSTAKSFAVSGQNLTAGLVVTPPTGFAISSDNSNFQTTAITLTPTDGTVASTTLYVRLIAGKVTGDYNGNVVCSSTGATSQNVSVSGTVGAGLYTLTMVANPTAGGTATATSSSVAQGNTTTITATPNTHYTFTSWTVSGTGASVVSTTTASTTFTMGTANATVTANFTEDTNYTVTWMVKGATLSTEKVYAGEKVAALPANPSVDGLDCATSPVFMGWVIDTNDPGVFGTTSTMPANIFASLADSPTINSNMTFVAVFASAE